MHEQRKIVSYWNGAGLTCPVSSTCNADHSISKFDNKIENIVLNNLLHELNRGLKETSSAPVLDVGAGYGRFTDTFLRYQWATL